MHLTLLQEQYSLAYVSAVASAAGYEVSIPKYDVDSIDGVLKSNEGIRPRIEFQAKATSMNVDICDQKSFEQLSPEDVCAYLTGNGWHETERIGDKGWVFEKGENELLIPARRNLGDYASRMADVVNTLAREEQRSQLSVYNDLSASGNDIIRVRALEGDENGTIPFHDGVVLYGAAEKMVKAGACSAIAPKPYYRSCNFALVKDYMKSVRLGQTERGSYVMTLLSPIGARLAEAPDKPPFPRMVTSHLAGSLHALRLSADEAADKDDFQAFEQRVEEGVNANLCEAVSSLASHGEGAELSISWAAPAEAAAPKEFFPHTMAPVIEEAAQEFKRNAPELDLRFTGKVVRLERQPEAFDGHATLLLDIKNKMRNINLQFTQAEYDRVIKAFQNNLLVSIAGDLFPRGNGRYEIHNPKNFHIHEQ
ncbi:MAG: hypothetical protein GY862_00545 [Gammaproteobacteria bacterium]|nr:hypothetical protein [Gammaproteobacteria bacterium]